MPPILYIVCEILVWNSALCGGGNWAQFLPIAEARGFFAHVMLNGATALYIKENDTSTPKSSVMSHLANGSRAFAHPTQATYLYSRKRLFQGAFCLLPKLFQLHLVSCLCYAYRKVKNSGALSGFRRTMSTLPPIAPRLSFIRGLIKIKPLI